jgi:hypothetical protein
MTMPGTAAPANPTAAAGGGPVAAATPCGSGSKWVNAKWIDTNACCGDQVKMEAEASPAPADGDARIEIRDSQGKVIDMLDAKLTGGKVACAWAAKAYSENWRKDETYFAVSAATVEGIMVSTNKFLFKARTTTGWNKLKLNLPGARNKFKAPGSPHYLRLEADCVHESLKISVIPDQRGYFSPDKKDKAKASIEAVWNSFGPRRFHRAKCQRGSACDCSYDCCKAGYRFDVNFVDSGYDCQVTMMTQDEHTDYKNPNMWTWTDPPPEPTVYAHEVGHLLYHYDEYEEGATDPTNEQPAKSDSLMACYDASGNPANKLYNRHFRWALKHLNEQVGGDDPYEIIPIGK